MKCKNIFGIKVCKYNYKLRSSIVELPQVMNPKIEVPIYTKKDCRICNTKISSILRQFSPLKDIIQAKIVDITDPSVKVPSNIFKVPEVLIGNQRLGTNFTDHDLISAIQQKIPKKI